MTLPPVNGHSLQAVLFDFGGVIAEEGFREGMKEIASRNGLDPEKFYHLASDTVYDSGYVVGASDEAAFWEMLCRRSGLKAYREEYTVIILERFRLRPAMLDLARQLKSRKMTVAILSDQTDWLDRLEERHRFGHLFDRVLNSYHVGLSKRDPEIFTYATHALEVPSEASLFVDDNRGHIDRAASCGLQTLHFTDQRRFFENLSGILPWAVP